MILSSQGRQVATSWSRWGPVNTSLWPIYLLVQVAIPIKWNMTGPWQNYSRKQLAPLTATIYNLLSLSATQIRTH